MPIIARYILASATLLLAAYFGCITLLGIVRNHTARQWTRSNGRILGIEDNERSASVVYSYVYNNRTFRGSSVAFLCRPAILEREYILSNYRTNMVVQVYLNPVDPQESVLEVREFNFGYIRNNLFIILVLAIFATLNLVGVRNARSQAASKSHASS